ncbi:hypothetical protein [Zunongwangia atlantica]|uniref:Effector-binding protein n=1 Tax=Zunongwangia atlantica 22II14-10F7 TaxID=1185767 RepID=A0A1Y1T3G4_9FLAO|nr:hypothetical protein [Zunongwangia atlantica]ORL45578.1 effector-binding protein [Zunongwangia atlantica 22II14-10F7]
MKKVLLGLFIVGLVGISIWYFAVKPYDYSIAFTTTTPSGIIYEKIQHWRYSSFSNAEIIDENLNKQVKHKLNFNDKSLIIDWEINRLNDSVNKIKAVVSHPEDVISSRFSLLIGKIKEQDSLKKELEIIRKSLEEDKSNYSIEIIGEAKAPKTDCACISLKGQLQQKAMLMMTNIGYLSDYILEHDLEMPAKPRVLVKNWDKETNEIKFDFCFPIIKKEGLPESDKIKLKTLPSFNAMHVVFNGNYLFTHYGWYKLQDYAKSKGLQLSEQVLEVFNDNPEMGGNSIEWKTDIYTLVR